MVWGKGIRRLEITPKFLRACGTKVLQQFDRILPAGLLVGLLASLCIVVAGHQLLVRTSDQFLVISKRSTLEDKDVIERSGDENGIRYSGPKGPLAEAVMRAYPGALDKDNFIVVLFRQNRMVRLLPSNLGKDMLSRRLLLLRLDNLTLWPIYAAIIGLALALVLPLTNSMASSMLTAAAATCLVKIETSCSTCATPQLFGIDPSLIGLVFFTFAAVILATNLKHSKLMVPLLLGTLCWQIFTAQAWPAFCLACASIALEVAWTIGSVRTWPTSLSGVKGNLFGARLRLIWPFVLPLGVLVASQLPSSQMPEPPSHPIHNIVLKSISQLGMKANGRRRAILITKSGCGVCDQLLKMIGQTKIIGLEYFVTSGPGPDLVHDWRQLPDSAQVSATPTLLLVRPDGSIEKQHSGFDGEFSSALRVVAEVNNFKTNGPKSSKEKP